MYGEPVLQAVHATGVFSHVATNRTCDLRGRIRGVVQSVAGRRLRNPQVDDARFDDVREALGASDNQKVLLHCASANRVGGVWLPYRVIDQGVDFEQALQEAKQVGLRSAWIRDKAIAYINRKTGNNYRAEKSVKPGINESFADPELEVEQYIKRFEVESREIYLLRKELVAACQLEPSDRIADVGAGTGLFTKLFSEATEGKGWVYAVDIAPKFIEHINQAAQREARGNVTGVICREDSINLAPGSVDKIFVCDTYHHFEYPQSTLASMFSALTEGGELIVIDFERVEGKTRPWLLDHVRAGKDVFRAEIQDAGFELVEEVQVDGLKENYFLRFRKPVKQD